VNPTPFAPGYRRMMASGELERRADRLDAHCARCELCPRRCGADRRSVLGTCRTPAVPVIASWGPHWGEEPPLSGTHGSGTVFLANCNLACAFCQNADISQLPAAWATHATTDAELARIMLELQARGCHNVNWVSPTHQLPALVRALVLAAEGGLSVPVVYNSNGYDAPDVLRLLDGVIDIYMPDLKYADARIGAELSDVGDYPSAARTAIVEMHRQLGSAWRLAPDGTLQRGLLVRMLVLPDALAGTCESIKWLADGVSPDVAVSLMCQYRPHHRAGRLPAHPDLGRTVNRDEYAATLAALAQYNRSSHTLVQRFA